MGDTERAAAELLRCFFSECEKRFRFLEQRYGYTFLCGLVEYQNNFKIIKPIQEHYDIGVFQAVTRYERDDQAIEILYGEDQFIIEGYAFYNPIERYELAEILNAAKKNEERAYGDWGVTNSELIQKTVRSMAHAIEKHAQLILDPSPKVLKRAMTIRQTRLEHTIRQKHQEIMNRASSEAARAYRKKNFKRVIELLEPHKNYLQRADLRKLEHSKKYLLSG